MPTEITFIFRKTEGYIPSGLGSRSFTVGRLADENLLDFKFLKNSLAGKISNIWLLRLKL